MHEAVADAAVEVGREVYGESSAVVRDCFLTAMDLEVLPVLQREQAQGVRS